VVFFAIFLLKQNPLDCLQNLMQSHDGLLCCKWTEKHHNLFTQKTPTDTGVCV